MLLKDPREINLTLRHRQLPAAETQVWAGALSIPLQVTHQFLSALSAALPAASDWGQQAVNPRLTLTVLFSLCNRCTSIWRNGWCISIQWQLPHTWGSVWQGDMWLKLAHLHPLSWDKSKSLILLLVTAALFYAVTWLKFEKKCCIPSVKMFLFQHWLKRDRKAVWKIQNLVLTRYQLVSSSSATGETYQ